MSETLHIVAASGASQTIDVSVADVWDVTLTANCTLSFTGAAGGSVYTIALLLRQDGTGGRTVTWPGSVVWPAGSAPTLHAGASALTLVTLSTVDGGTTWLGFAEPSDGAAGSTGAKGSAGSNGTNGTLGGGVSIPYTFSTTTTDSDPGNGNLRLDNATQNAATTIRADLLASDGTDWTAILATLADSTNTVKGHIRLFKASDATKWIVFTVSALASPSGYKNITVAVIGASSSSPFSNGDAISLEFSRAGDKGTAGTVTPTSFIKRTAGDLSLTNDGSFHDVPTIGDLTIAAAVGDVLMIVLNGTVDNNVRFEVQLPTSGNYAGPGVSSTQGISGWAARTSAAANVGGVIYYTVVSGDISGGNVLCRLRYSTASSGATKIFAAAAVGPLIFGVSNLGH